MCCSISFVGLCFECVQMDWGGGRGQHIHLKPFAVFGMQPESKLDSPVGPARTPTTSNHTPQHVGSALIFGSLLGRINHELSRCPHEHVHVLTSLCWPEYLRITQSPCRPHHQRSRKFCLTLKRWLKSKFSSTQTWKPITLSRLQYFIYLFFKNCMSVIIKLINDQAFRHI